MPARFVPSTTTICNQALAHIGVGRLIKTLSDNTDEAASCSAFYDSTRDEVLRAWNWPFARRYATLTLVAGSVSTKATQDYQYSYRWPADCLRPRRIANTFRTDDNRTRIPFAVGSDGAGSGPLGRLIYTDLQPIAASGENLAMPYLEYTAEVTDETQFDQDFAQAFSYLLASYIAPRLTSGDQFGLGKQAFQAYEVWIDKARSDALNEEGLDPDPDSQLTRARD